MKSKTNKNFQRKEKLLMKKNNNYLLIKKNYKRN